MNAFLLFGALLGHAFLWIGLVNRLHALGIRRRIIKLITVGCVACAALFPIVVGWHYAHHPATASWGWPSDGTTAGLLVSGYVTACWMAAAVTLVRLVYLRVIRRPPSILRFYGRRSARIDLASAAANATELDHHFLTRLPLNEVLQLEISQWVLDVPRLAPELDGLSIVQLSDLHFTGRIGKAYFREVVRTSNELRPDLVCITGDIMDRAICFDWIADTLGQLSARHGVYFILGNHDRAVDTLRLRCTLEQSGLIDVGGRWQEVDIAGESVMLAGDERPWFRTTPDLTDCPPPDCHALRVALTHTPDQFGWARSHNADLMLAGHTHAGQIRIPPLGAIFTPTAQGVKYISGVFYAPPTILHVSRGVSGDVPIRWNCPPEIAHLRLRAGTKP